MPNQQLIETRVYPFQCQSAQCGRSECDGCVSEPVLAEFKAWVETTKAHVADAVWSPSVYEARSQG